MAYVLEVGTFESIPMPYTYGRRAQATVYRTVWKQVAVCDEIEPLRECAKGMATPGFEFRITGVGEHCRFTPISIDHYPTQDTSDTAAPAAPAST